MREITVSQNAALALLLLLTFAIFVAGVWLLASILKLVLLRIPTAVTEANRAPKALSAIIALAIAFPFARYVLLVVADLLSLFPEAILFFLDDGGSSLETCGSDCGSTLFTVFTGFFFQTMEQTIAALHLKDFPIGSFITFLLVFGILYVLYLGLQRAYASPVILKSAFIGLFPRFASVNAVFFVLVLTAFYLCLSALLALPLLQPRARTEGFSDENLSTIIAADLPAQESFEAKFPPLGVKMERQPPAALSRRAAERYLIGRLADQATTLTEHWNAIRAGAYDELADLGESALSTFRAENAEAFGVRETIAHFAKVARWHRENINEKQRAMFNCQSSATSWISKANAFVQDLALARGEGQQAANEEDDAAMYARYSELSNDYEGALGSCRLAQVPPPDHVPTREPHGSSLGVVGYSSRWLLETGSMPVVIIVGLIGFSLLGATISRVVRAVGTSVGFGRLTAVDLLVVVSGGAAAALVVFLASYGGLAVLGEGGSDPNPYVVFSACLIGAIFSEDVWLWARRRILGSLDQGLEPPRNLTAATGEETVPLENAAPDQREPVTSAGSPQDAPPPWPPGSRPT
jgi:hypothetical protein